MKPDEPAEPGDRRRGGLRRRHRRDNDQRGTTAERGHDTERGHDAEYGHDVQHGDSDAQLARSAHGDSAAFTHLVKAHSSALHGYFARRMPAASEDLLAETWLQAFAARRTFDPARGSARGWLFGVAHNVLAQHLRRAGRTEPAPGPDVTDPWQVVDQRLDAAAMAPALRRALAELPLRSGSCCSSSAGSSSPRPRPPPSWASRRAPPVRGCTGPAADCVTGSRCPARRGGT